MASTLRHYGLSGFALLILILSTACGSQQPTSTAPTPTVPTSTALPTLTSTALVEDLPANCRVSQVAKLIQNFVGVYNAGPLDQLGQYFDLDSFEYFVGGNRAGRPFEEIRTSSRAELLAYLSQRRSQHEQIQMVDRPDISLDSTRANSVLVLVDVSRRADDFPEAKARVKSIIDCKVSQISRWIWYGFELN